jgi:hypothetical protein
VGRRLPHLLALLAGLALAALVATGCGGDRSNLIPSSRAQELVSQLDALQQQIDAGKCDGINARVDTFHDDATSLTKPVDSRLRKRINDGVKALQEHALDTCEAAARRNAEQTQTDTTPDDTQTTDTTTTETTTTKTDTTPTTSTPTTSTPSSSQPSTVTPPGTGGGTAGPSDTTPGDTGDGGDGTGGSSDGDTQ